MIGIATIVVDQITTIVVGIATIVVDCDNCEHCDNCDHIMDPFAISQSQLHVGGRKLQCLKFNKNCFPFPGE